MYVSSGIAKILKQEGTEVVFCFPTSPLIEGAAIEGIRVITCRTERTVTNMADGYTRMLNGKRIGVCMVQSGPGIENAYVGVAQAYADSTPLFMLPSGPARRRQGFPAEYDPVDEYRGITKWAGTVDTASRIPDLMGRAFSKLRNGRRRPVLLEVPSDLSWEQVEDSKLDYEPVQTHASAGDPGDVTKAIRMLLQAKRPIFYVGQGVLWADASRELVELAELVQVPVMNTILAKSVFPEDHPLALGTGGSTVTGMIDHFLIAADLVFCIGASLSHTLAATPVPAGKIVIQCTQDEDDLDTEYRAAHAVIGDAKLVLNQLIDEAKLQIEKSGRRDTVGVAREVSAIKEKWLQQWMPKLTSDEVPINPYRIVWDLMHTIDRNNAIVTHDSGAPRGQIATFYRALVPRSYIGWGNSHQLGSSLGLIMGAKLAAPDKLAVAYMGDAAFGMCGMDLETAVRERIPVLALVLNNSWMSGYRPVIPVATERYNVGNISGDYTKIAQGLGCYAERIEQPKEIISALKRATKIVESGKPALLEFMTCVEEAGPERGNPGPEGRMVRPSSAKQS